MAPCAAAGNALATRALQELRQQRPGRDHEGRAAPLALGPCGASTYLQVGRNVVRAAHGDEAPLVVDPF